jgi:hypothetical protein
MRDGWNAAVFPSFEQAALDDRAAKPDIKGKRPQSLEGQ